MSNVQSLKDQFLLERLWAFSNNHMYNANLRTLVTKHLLSVSKQLYKKTQQEQQK